MSVYITEVRGINAEMGNSSKSVCTAIRRDSCMSDRHRYPRFDVFMYALRSYAALPLDRVYLYVELDGNLPDVAARRRQLEGNASALFGQRLRTLQHRRLVEQEQWQQELNLTIAPPMGGGDAYEDANRLVFFLQNDDHPFVDTSQDVLLDGLAQLRADTSRFKTLFMSHWSEILTLIGKQERPKFAGAYAYAEITQTDTFQIFNFGYLRYLLADLNWTKPLRRLDEMFRMHQIYRPRSGPKYTMYTTSVALQRMFVPLREQCRKFDAYMQANISKQIVPMLVLPPEMNHENSTLPRDAKTVLRVLATPGDTRWSGMRRVGLGTFRPIPELVKRAIKLSTATLEAATTALLAEEAAEKEAAAKKGNGKKKKKKKKVKAAPSLAFFKAAASFQAKAAAAESAPSAGVPKPVAAEAG